MKKGRSLIEVLVASILLTIVITASMLLFTENNKILSNNDRKFVAEKIIKQYFEEISVANSRDAVLGIIGTSDSNISLTDQASNGSTYTYILSFAREEIDVTENNSHAGTTQPTVLKVTATVSWSDVGSGNLVLSTITI